MGLSIHYYLTAPSDTDAAQAGDLVRQLRRQALVYRRRGRVDNVGPLRSDPASLRQAREYKCIPVPGRPGNAWEVEVRPTEGFLFMVAVGEDCEPLPLALCRYPATVVWQGQRHGTGRRGWYFHGFSKTQYASLHGWEHFRRCHTAVIDLLAAARSIGWRVVIHDEGEYWPGRDLEALRRGLDEMNGVVAAAAGALKDWGEDREGSPVQSPILSHPHFERLEAEGAARGHAARLRKVLP